MGSLLPSTFECQLASDTHIVTLEISEGNLDCRWLQIARAAGVFRIRLVRGYTLAEWQYDFGPDEGLAWVHDPVS